MQILILCLVFPAWTWTAGFSFMVPTNPPGSNDRERFPANKLILDSTLSAWHGTAEWREWDINSDVVKQATAERLRNIWLTFECLPPSGQKLNNAALTSSDKSSVQAFPVECFSLFFITYLWMQFSFNMFPVWFQAATCLCAFSCTIPICRHFSRDTIFFTPYVQVLHGHNFL